MENVECMDVDWTEKARQHSAGRSAHDLSQKIATPSCGNNRSYEIKPTAEIHHFTLEKWNLKMIFHSMS